MTSAPGRRLAVVVLTWNERDDLLACLASLLPQLGPDDAAIVCDNGSNDGTEAAVRGRFPGVVYLQNGANLGFAGGNNPGLRRALDDGYRRVMLLNNDTVLPPGAIGALLAFAESRPDAAVVQPALVSEDASEIDSIGLEPRRFLGVRSAGTGEPAAAIPAEPCEIFGASGAAALMRADSLRAAGLLDDALFVMAEDADLAFRLRMTGGSAWLVPGVRVAHRRGISGRPPNPRVARLRKLWLQRNTVALALRYWPLRWLVASLPLLAYRAAQALVLAAREPQFPCGPLWRASRAARRSSRAALREHGADRWFR